MTSTDFSRKEVMEFTGATPNQLQYLDCTGTIEPMRIWGNKKKPDVCYTLRQVINIKIIRLLREKTPFQTLRKVLNCFDRCHEEKELQNKRLVIVDNKIIWVDEENNNLGSQIKGDGKGIGRYVLLIFPTFEEIMEELNELEKAKARRKPSRKS